MRHFAFKYCTRHSRVMMINLLSTTDYKFKTTEETYQTYLLGDCYFILIKVVVK